MSSRKPKNKSDELAPIYDLDNHSAHLLRRVHQRATLVFQEELEGDSITPMQFSVLGTLLAHGPLSQNLLGRMTAMDPSTVSLVVRALVKRKLTTKKPSREDNRMLQIELTPEGEAFTLARLHKSDLVSKRLLEPLSSGEAAIFKELLKKLALHPEK